MFELSGVNYEEVLEQGDLILVRVIASSSYRGFELSGLYCILQILHFRVIQHQIMSPVKIKFIKYNKEVVNFNKPVAFTHES